jgi:hypothetical protein
VKILLAFSLLMATAAASAAEESDIIVIAQRLKGVTAIVDRDDRGRFRCAVSQSTGLPRLDQALCKTASKCVRDGASDADAVNACVTARKPALLDAVRTQLKARTS